jgi:hypothetical protein
VAAMVRLVRLQFSIVRAGMCIVNRRASETINDNEQRRRILFFFLFMFVILALFIARRAHPSKDPKIHQELNYKGKKRNRYRYDQQRQHKKERSDEGIEEKSHVISPNKLL